MTPHADRDRSEPYWPPTATREPRVRFPLDDGDTGVSLLPVAPAGTLLRCPVCPAALADTRGGRLDHCDDGSHHYVPAQPVEAPTADRVEKFAQAIYDVGVDHPMWIGDDGKPLDYLPARETRLADFVYQAAAAVVAVADAERAAP